MASGVTSAVCTGRRYAVGPDQNEGRECVKPDETPLAVHLDLRQPLDGRTVYAGSTGYRTLLN